MNIKWKFGMNSSVELLFSYLKNRLKEKMSRIELILSKLLIGAILL